MQPGTPRFSGGETTSPPNIDTFGRYLIIFGRFFRGMSLKEDRDPGGANIYIFVPSLGLPKTTARVGSISSIAEKKLSDVHGVRSLIVYSISQCILIAYANFPCTWSHLTPNKWFSVVTA